jgi:hypothetical protein
MFEKRPWMFVGIGTPVVFDVLNREGKNVARIHRDGTKWFVQSMEDYSYRETRFNSPDDALASLS